MKYDIIVIGAGSGGLNMAGFMNKAGFKTLLIDKSDATIGGDCLNFGCVPSKALIHVSRIVNDAKEANKFGLSVKGKVNLKKVAQYIKSKQNVIREHENASHFRSLGMDVALGPAKFVSKDTVEVAGKQYTGKKIILAVGGRPRKLKLPGVEKVKYYDNENIFQLNKLPEKMVIIGGGPIGIEISQAFNRLGTKVTVVQDMADFLPKEAHEIAQVLLKQLQNEGIKFYFKAKTQKFTSSKELLITDEKGKKKKIAFDIVFVGIGRVLNLEGLDFEKAGIELDESKRKLIVDEYLRTTNKNVYTCGDIAGSFMFTHAAEMHAGIILHNFFSPKKKTLNNDNLSWVTYTDPEIATFGIWENALKQRNIPYEKLTVDFTDDDRAIVDETTYGKLILFISKKGKLLGGSMVAKNAGELFQELVLANTANLSIKHFFNKIYPYPTASRINKRIITNYFSKKLTPFNKKLLRILY